MKIGQWATTKQNFEKFQKVLHTDQSQTGIILIFSINESRGFQGYATIDELCEESTNKLFVDSHGKESKWENVIKISWVSTNCLSFDETRQLRNPYNDNKPVKISRDGQQIEGKVGFTLCKMIESSGIDWLTSSYSREGSVSPHITPRKPFNADYANYDSYANLNYPDQMHNSMDIRSPDMKNYQNHDIQFQNSTIFNNLMQNYT